MDKKKFLKITFNNKRLKAHYEDLNIIKKIKNVFFNLF